MACAMASSFQSPALSHQNSDNFCSYTINNHTNIPFSFQNANTELSHHTAATIAASGKRQPQPNNINTNVFASVLQACANIEQLQQFHARMITTGLDRSTFLLAKLVAVYVQLGKMDCARLMFEESRGCDVSLWNAMIRGYANNDFPEQALELYKQMELAGVKRNRFTFPPVLKACTSLLNLQLGIEIHGGIVGTGYISDVFVANSLITMYTKCGYVEDARQVFDEMLERDLVSWNSMIAGYSQNGHANEALMFLREMQLHGVEKDAITMVAVLSACTQLAALQQGKEIHAFVIRRQLESDVSNNALIDMYAKCGRLETAHNLFDNMCDGDVVSWNALITGYAQEGHAGKALKLFGEMQWQGMKPSVVTVVSVLPACACLSVLQEGKQIHGYVIRNGLESNVVVGNALIHMYGKCRTLEIASKLFERIPERSVVSWNAMIAGYVLNGHANEATILFARMLLEGIKPDSVTIGSVLPAFPRSSDLQQGKQIHGYIVRNGFDKDVVVGTGLIDMYAKCGRIEVARHIFDQLCQRNVVSWSAMIAGYAQNGHAYEALTLFMDMEVQGIETDPILVLSVLQACAHLSALGEGKQIHAYIIRNELKSDIAVGNSLIDMYAKCGSIDIAHLLFEKMSKRNVVSWNAMISGCGMHGHVEDALALFDKMQEQGIKPNHVTFISILSACSHSGLVDKGWHYFNCMNPCYNISPRVEHYACMVDMLGRSGLLDEAYEFIKKMPLEPTANVWGALLGACRIHSSIALGECVAEHIIELEPQNASCYVLLSNIYAEANRWADVARVRSLMKEKGLKKPAGYSWIDIKKKVHRFFVGDMLYPQFEKKYAMLETLNREMKEERYVLDTKFAFHDLEAKEDMVP